MNAIEGLLASLLNPNPGVQRAGLLGPNAMAQTGLGPEQLARYHQMSGMGGGQAMPAPQAAPSGAMQPPAAPQAPDQMQTASTAPSGGGFMGGLGDAIGGLFNPKGAQKNRTVQLLMQDGLDEGTATLVAQDKTSLNHYLRQRAFGEGPKADEYQQRSQVAQQFGLSGDEAKSFILTGNMPDKTQPNRPTAVVNGKVVDTNTGQVIGDYGSGNDNEYLERQGAATAFGLKEGTPEYQRFILTGDMPDNRDQDPAFRSEMELRKEYDMLPEVKDYKTVRSNYERIRQGVQLGTGAGDAAIVFGYMKMLDPTSVVREGEQATTRNAAGVPEAVRGMYNQLVGGGQLSGEARQQILGAAEKVYGESSANIEDVNKRYGGYASQYQLDPARITSPVEQYDPLAPASQPALPTPDGGWREISPGVRIRRKQ